MEFGTIWGRILESFWRNLDLEGPSVPAWRVFIDFWSIWGSNLEAFRQPWGLCLATWGAPWANIEVFFGYLFPGHFLDDFWSDSRVSGTPKTSIWLERGSKNKFFTEIGIQSALRASAVDPATTFSGRAT